MAAVLCFLQVRGRTLIRADDAIQVSSLTESAERDPEQRVIRLNSGCTAFSLSSFLSFRAARLWVPQVAIRAQLRSRGELPALLTAGCHLTRGRARAFVLRRKPGWWAFACRCPGGLEAWSLFSGG